MTIALFDFTPSYCPFCGRRIRFTGIYQERDYKAHCSYSCACGLSYQLIPTADLLEIAGKHGDLDRFQTK